MSLSCSGSCLGFAFEGSDVTHLEVVSWTCLSSCEGMRDMMYERSECNFREPTNPSRLGDRKAIKAKTRLSLVGSQCETVVTNV
jgi:hypothetical protein